MGCYNSTEFEDLRMAGTWLVLINIIILSCAMNQLFNLLMKQIHVFQIPDMAQCTGCEGSATACYDLEII